MRANKYIQTSDFLSLAMLYRDTKNVTFEAKTVPRGTTTRYEKRAYAPYYSGSIDRFCTRVNGSDAMYGSNIDFYPDTGEHENDMVRFVLSSDADGYLTITQVVFNRSTEPWNIQQYDLEIFLQRFASPDLF